MAGPMPLPPCDQDDRPGEVEGRGGPGVAPSAVVVADDVHGGLLSRGRGAVDALVLGPQLRLLVAVAVVALGQPAGPRVADLVVAQLAVGADDVPETVAVVLRAAVRQLTGQPAGQGLPRRLLLAGHPPVVGGHGAVARGVAAVEHVAVAVVLQGVLWLQQRGRLLRVRVVGPAEPAAAHAALPSEIRGPTAISGPPWFLPIVAHRTALGGLSVRLADALLE